jgi:hypothetical protein
VVRVGGFFLQAIDVYAEGSALVVWIPLLSAAVGAMIGLAGDWSGRINARRQELRARTIMLEDEARVRANSVEDERRRESDRRARQAAETIVTAFRDNLVALTDHATADVRPQARNLVMVVFTERVHVLDPELRRRLYQVEQVLDLETTDAEIGSRSSSEVIFLARRESIHMLGAYLRREPIPDASADWRNVLAEMTAAMAERRRSLIAEGYQIDFASWADP